MILELRTYTADSDKVQVWLDNYEKHGLPVQLRVLGRLVGFFTNVAGEPTQLVHMWAYDSLADRAARRSALANDPEWQLYLRNRPPSLSASQEIKILTPTAFSPLK